MSISKETHRKYIQALIDDLTDLVPMKALSAAHEVIRDPVTGQNVPYQRVIKRQYRSRTYTIDIKDQQTLLENQDEHE